MNLVRGLRIFSVTALLLPWTLGAVNPQQESSLGVVLAETTVPPSPAGIPAMNMVTIQQVLPNSPAALAGLLPGDGIVRVDNSPVLNASDVTQWVKTRTAKEGVTLTIMRRGWLGQYVPMLVPVLLPPGAACFAGPRIHFRPQAGASDGGLAGSQVQLESPAGENVLYREPYLLRYRPAGLVCVGTDKRRQRCRFGSARFQLGELGKPGRDRGGAERHSVSRHSGGGHPVGSLEWRGGQRVHVTYGEPIRDEFGYIWLPFVKEHLKARGVVIYRVFPVPYDSQGYILVSRIAQTPEAPLGAEGGSGAQGRAFHSL